MASSVDKTGIVQTGCGLFSVPSGTVKEKRHQVDFGDETKMPSCSCGDWIKSYYLCKHFFAIFEKFPVYSWNALSPLYRNSPYFSLDIDIKCITDNITDNDNVQEEYYNGDVETERDDRQEECHTEKNVPRISCNEKVRKNFGLSCANTCRELLNEIKGLTYLVEDQQGTLNELQETLFQAKKKLANIAKKENGFMLEKKATRK